MCSRMLQFLKLSMVEQFNPKTRLKKTFSFFLSDVLRALPSKFRKKGLIRAEYFFFLSKTHSVYKKNTELSILLPELLSTDRRSHEAWRSEAMLALGWRSGEVSHEYTSSVCKVSRKSSIEVTICMSSNILVWFGRNASEKGVAGLTESLISSLFAIAKGLEKYKRLNSRTLFGT